ncbi:MAG: HD domain-containing protein, partial [Kineosporiaceae bacterium]
MPDVTAPMDTLDPAGPSAPGAVPSDESADADDDGEGPARDGSAAARATPPARTRSTPSPTSAQARHRHSSPGEGLTTPSRVLSRIARFGSGRGATTSPLLEPLLRTVRTVHPKADLSLIEKAFAVAATAHAGQKRRSGDPYITHPVAVAGILAELGMTPPTLAAALLHDTVEDTPYTLEQLRKDFGDEVAMLVDGVTKLDKVTYGDAAQAETVRKMVVAMSRDIRVLVIKLADRLHNARTW